MIQLVTPPAIAPETPVAVVPAAAKKTSSTARPKLPAYAKTLLLNRRGGFHPQQVVVIYGDQWRLAVDTKHREEDAKAAGLDPYSEPWIERCGVPTVAVRPLEYEPGMVDWRPLAGCEVFVDDQKNEFYDPESRCRWLLGDLARWAANIEVGAGVRPGKPGHEVGFLAFTERVFDSDSRVMRWPDWWSDELNTIYKQRNEQWFSHVMRTIDANKTGTRSPE